MAMLDHALAALARGWHVFPVVEYGKEPHPIAGPWGQAATGDVRRVLDWWNRAPAANVGLAAKGSRLLIVDCDIAKTDMNLVGTPYAHLHTEKRKLRVDGFEVLSVYASERGATASDFDTFTVRTRAGGLHLYYLWPENWPTAVQTSIVKGCVDTRTNGGQWGGYVLAPGSVVIADGYAGRYDIERDLPIAYPPQWVRSLVAEKPRVVQPKSQFAQPGSVSFGGLEASVRDAIPGNRNNALLWAARSMCSDGADMSEAEELLGKAAEQAGLDDFEITQTIRSAYRLQQHVEGTE